MYTYNILCFGHELSVNKELNNFLLMYDVEFFDVIKGDEWQVSFPYHGGQVKGDTHSCVFGTIITDDDDNPYYLQEVRGLKEEDYLPDYQIFLDKLYAEFQNDIEHMNTNFNKSLDEIEYKEAYIQLIVELKEFLKKNKPKFYTVEASS